MGEGRGREGRRQNGSEDRNEEKRLNQFDIEGVAKSSDIYEARDNLTNAEPKCTNDLQMPVLIVTNENAMVHACMDQQGMDMENS